jgi:hypothetical protein
MAANTDSELTNWGDMAYEEGLRTPQNKPTRPADTNAPKRPTKTKPATADPATAAVARQLEFGTKLKNNRYVVLAYDSE